jgi:signal-transduction protein with cAMP-binding, CBS, and nucleotidyltransferase domain
MVLVLIGELGVYNQDNELMQTLSENMTFGERALRIEETCKINLVAQKVSVCLSLSRQDFEE